MNRRIRYSKEYLEITRSQYPPKYIGRIIRFMGIQDDMRILEVGCGTGHITRHIAKNLNGGEVYGIDSDHELLEVARESNKGSKYEVMYLEQNAYDLEFEDEFFDMVVLHSFLGTIIYPAQALREIGRVLKLGGKVIVVEPTQSGFMYFPQFSPDFADLEKKATECYREGLIKHGFMPFIAYKIPQLLIEQGFIELKSTGYTNIDLICSYENKDAEVNKYKYYLENYDKINETSFYFMQEGGFSEEEIDIFRQTFKAWFARIIENPDLLDKYAECGISNMIAFKATKFF